MTDTAKPTPKNIGLNDFWDKFQNEAWESYRMTGLTPRQLLKRVRELEAALKPFADKCDIAERHIKEHPTWFKYSGDSLCISEIQEATPTLGVLRKAKAALAKHGEGV